MIYTFLVIMRLPAATLALLAMSTAQALPRVLVYTRTQGYRHDSIPTAIDVLKQNGGGNGLEFEFSE